MYTLEQLQNKSINELKEIGCELNVFPEGDRRLRQTWIDAIAGVNPPLLQLLEVSPAEVQAQEPPLESKFGRIVYPRPSQGAISQVAKTSPAVEVDQAQEAIESPPAALVCPSCSAVHALYTDNDYLYRPVIHCLHCSYCRSKNYLGPIRIEVQGAISQVAKTSSGVEVDQLPECVQCFDDGYFEDEPGLINSCVCSSSEPKLSRQNAQRAIVPVAKISKSDQNSILTGITLSDRFLARYASPQSEILHYDTDGYKVDPDGQLSLFDVQVQSPPEPPDPDDFESLDAFREAIALWDAQNPELLAVSMDSMCEWAPCPEEWYEPEAESLPLKPSSMMELSPPAIESSSTSDFFIPTFDAWCDRENRQTDTDEPPDTGIFARLPGPKPPKFPPGAIGYTQPNRPLNAASRNYPETIPRLFSRVVAGSSTQPARSPPGGDA